MRRFPRVALALGVVLIFGIAWLGYRSMPVDDATPATKQIEKTPVRAQAVDRAAMPAVVQAHEPRREEPQVEAATLRGRVVDALTREPVREFELVLQRARGGAADDESPRTQVFSTVDGRFEWRVPPGDWGVTASALGYQRFELGPLALSQGESTAEHVLPLRRGHELRGRIYDRASGAGIASARIAFRESHIGRFEGNWRERSSVSSAKDGSFVLEGVPAAHVTIEISAAEYAGREVDVTVGEANAPLEIGLSAGGTIAGRLTAADGVTPIAGMVGLFSLDRGFGGSRRTDERGEFAHRHLAPGRYRLSGTAGGVVVTKDIELAEGERLEDIVLALGTGRSVRGVVAGLLPEEIGRAIVRVQREGELPIFAPEAVVDERGAYALHDVPPGRARLVADTMRRQASKPIEIPADADLEVDLEFAAGSRVSGRVTRGGVPVARTTVTPRPVTERSDSFSYGTSTTDDGEYELYGLPAGEYNFWVAGYRTAAIQVSGDRRFDIEVPDPHFAGRLLEQGGSVPVVGADVELLSADPGRESFRLHARTDHFGQFALAGLEPGDFLLTIYKPGHEMYRERISYDSPRTDLTIELRREAGARVRVRDAGSGEHLRRVHVTELIDGRRGSYLRLSADDDGIAHLPLAMAGGTLSFSAPGYVPAVVHWAGQDLDLRLSRADER